MTAPPPSSGRRPASRWEWEKAFRKDGNGRRGTADRVRPAALAFAFVLASYANADGSSITVGQKALVRLTGYTEETVGRFMKELRAAGLIERVSCGSTAARRVAADEHRLTLPVADGGPTQVPSGLVDSQPTPVLSGLVDSQPTPVPSATNPGSVDRPTPTEPGSTRSGPDQDQQAAARTTPTNLDEAVALILAELPGWTATAEDTRLCLQALRQDGGPNRNPTIKRSPRGWVKRLLDDGDHDDLRAHLNRVRPPALPPVYVREAAGDMATREGREAAKTAFATRRRRKPERVRDAS